MKNSFMFSCNSMVPFYHHPYTFGKQKMTGTCARGTSRHYHHFSPSPPAERDGERELVVVSAVPLSWRHLTFEQSPEHFIHTGLQPGGWTPNSRAQPFQRLLQPRETR